MNAHILRFFLCRQSADPVEEGKTDQQNPNPFFIQKAPEMAGKQTFLGFKNTPFGRIDIEILTRDLEFHG